MRKQSKLVGNMVLVLALLGGLSIILTGCGDDTGITNNPPTFSAIGAKTVAEGETLTFAVMASDKDNDELTLRMDNQPANSQFVDNGDGNGTFTFTPNYNQDGTVQATFIASDSKDEGFATVDITVDDRAFSHHAGTIPANETWVAADNPHLISSDIEVTDGAILTIENGCEVYFIEGKRIRVGYEGPGGLQASGAKFTSVLDSPTRGIWDGIAFAGQTIESSLDGCIIEYGGGNGFGNIFVQDGAVSINNCTIENSSTNGVYFLGEGHVTNFQGNVIANNGAYPVTVSCNYLGGLQGSSLTGNDKDTVIVQDTLVTTSASWDTLGVPFLFKEQFEIANGATVTLVPGLTLSFDAGAGIIVGVQSAGTLVADGTAKEILFTTSRPSPTSGEWEGIAFGKYADASCQLTNCLVEYAGENQLGAIYVDDAEVAINSTTVRYSMGYGVYFRGEGRFSSFEDNVITQNDKLPVLIGATYAGDLTVSNSYTGNATDRIQVAADVVDVESTWDDLGIPYYVSGIVSVDDGGILTLAPGSELLFANSAGMVIGQAGVGTLIADGSLGEITLGSSTGADFWVGIKFMSNVSPNSLLDSCAIDRAGVQQTQVYGGIYLEDCQVSIRHCTVTNGGNIGLAFIGTAYPLSFAGNTITTCNSYPVAIDCDYIGNLPSGNDLTGNANDAIELGGNEIRTSTTWDNPGIPLIIGELITINSGVQLVLSPGLELKFRDVAGLVIDQNASLNADGTTHQIKFLAENEAKNWKGLRFTSGASPSSALKACLIDKGGKWRNYEPDRGRYPGCIFLDDCHITITDCTISGSKAYGIFLKEDGHIDEFHGNVISDNDGAPVRVEVRGVHYLDAENTFSGNGEDVIEIGGNLDNDDAVGVLTQSVSWADMGIPYLVQDSVRICGGAQLTITEGIAFQIVKIMNITVCDGASLVAAGTADNPITFAAETSSWGAITMAGDSNDNSLLDYCIVNEGGRDRCGMIKLINCNPTITNCTISDSRTCGICLSGTADTDAYLENNTFESNAEGNVCND